MRTSIAKLDTSLGRLRQMPEAAVKAMASSLESKGQLSPVVASRQDGTLVLVDGFVRRMAAQRVGMDTLLVEVVTLSAVQMKTQMYLRNRDRGMLLLEECRLVRELIELDGLQQIEVSDQLERHKSWVSRRLALCRGLSPHLLSEGELGTLPGGCLRSLAQLPARNQERLWACARQANLSPSDTTLLVDLWRRAPDPEARRFVEQQPLEALRLARAKPQAKVDVRLGAAGEEVRTSLNLVRRASLRAARRVREGMGELPPEGIALLVDLLCKTRTDSTDALGVIDGWLVTQRSDDERPRET